VVATKPTDDPYQGQPYWSVDEVRSRCDLRVHPASFHSVPVAHRDLHVDGHSSVVRNIILSGSDNRWRKDLP